MALPYQAENNAFGSSSLGGPPLGRPSAAKPANSQLPPQSPLQQGAAQFGTDMFRDGAPGRMVPPGIPNHGPPLGQALNAADNANPGVTTTELLVPHSPGQSRPRNELPHAGPAWQPFGPDGQPIPRQDGGLIPAGTTLFIVDRLMTAIEKVVADRTAFSEIRRVFQSIMIPMLESPKEFIEVE